MNVALSEYTEFVFKLVSPWRHLILDPALSRSLLTLRVLKLVMADH